MGRKYLIRIILILSLIFLSLTILPYGACTVETNSIALYFTEDNGLSTAAPTSEQGQSTAVGPSIGVVSSTTIGTWTTEPLVKPIIITGTATATIWVSGRGSAYFEFDLLIDNDPTGTTITTGTSRLTQAPVELMGEQSIVELEVAANAVFGVEI